jgi:hypothetical protein
MHADCRRFKDLLEPDLFKYTHACIRRSPLGADLVAGISLPLLVRPVFVDLVYVGSL